MAVTRRALLVTAAAGTGLAIGWAVWPRTRATNWAVAEGETPLGAFLKIGVDGRVIVAVPQAEMGQGVWSALAQIAADELGADWNAVGVEPAPLGPDYGNRGMLIDTLGGMPAVVRGAAGWAGGKVIEYFDFQITGGSTSVRGFEAPLRAAGASAREMLCRAAARRWGVDWQDCDTQGGFVVHKANRLAFADVVKDAVAEDAPASPTLRSAPQLAGKPLLRLDIPSKTDGSARFGADVRLPGMMYAAIRHDPIGAVRTGIDRKALPATARLVEGPDFIAVVADGWYAARTALDGVTPAYKPTARPAGPWIEAGLKAALATPGDVVQDVGDVAAASGQGAITADYSLPFLAHAALEPMTATARIDGGKCEVWAPTQSATLSNWAVARALGFEDSAVTIYPTLVGGAFGRKIETDAVVAAALIARAAGRPVQLIYAREDDFGHDMWRPAVAARLKGAAGPQGVTAWDGHVAVPDVAASVVARNLPRLAGDPKTGAAAIEGSVHLPYAIPNFRAAHSLADCPVPLGFWRSVGNSFSGFVTECFIDELAGAANADPGRFRLGMLQDRPRHAAVLRAVLKAGGPLGRQAPGIGRGVALVECFGSIVAEVAEVVVTPEGFSVPRVWAAIDCGRTINPDTVRAQVESGICYGLSAALTGRTSFADGMAVERNFDSQPVLTLADAPRIEVIIIASDAAPGGVGEPGTPPIAPAVANALFAATGRRHRDLPLVRPQALAA
ncbi:xanthine dehydrogenase family protein molybdopterin-binding subunit [Polymorphobacter fuscus]|uniref:Molybdopterin-dependent oxidoreductase n=1 Tax=Sandarakinorhabdus fusca TaxID=1439888 RepID=A0A7C9KYJ1_9SPHN|nr:molybdopterin cofactor-binding domain-containing protein [Polymorphobacter fuscus]KAB7644478.1 xanthine dehydrogenase family protein molybdopterin-binding subunit [Polymorphobacter fuscus]MQT18406.1 molybdopterin-dependent oxidoreductase [Polymorphobacter fuscus]NJC08306.1 isoquinoline 1-oxidoreductase beta subunit [Polymorphobacter fuscus]